MQAMWLKYGLALLATFLTGIHEVARGKTNLACLYCGVGALASQAALFKQIQEPLLPR